MTVRRASISSSVQQTASLPLCLNCIPRHLPIDTHPLSKHYLLRDIRISRWVLVPHFISSRLLQHVRPYVRRPGLHELAPPFSRHSSPLHDPPTQPWPQPECPSEQRNCQHKYELLQRKDVRGYQYHPATRLLQEVRRCRRRRLRKDLSLDQLFTGLLPRGMSHPPESDYH